MKNLLSLLIACWAVIFVPFGFLAAEETVSEEPALSGLETAQEWRNGSLTEQIKILECKGNITMPAEYAAALEVYNQGEAAFKDQKDYEGALACYQKAVVLFQTITSAVLEKRQTAETAMSDTRKILDQSNAKLDEAEEIIRMRSAHTADSSL